MDMVAKLHRTAGNSEGEGNMDKMFRRTLSFPPLPFSLRGFCPIFSCPYTNLLTTEHKTHYVHVDFVATRHPQSKHIFVVKLNKCEGDTTVLVHVALSTSSDFCNNVHLNLCVNYSRCWNEQFLKDTSVQCRLFIAMTIKVGQDWKISQYK